MPRVFIKRDPKTKGEVVDRLLSFDFTGDLRDLGSERATIERTSQQSFLLRFPDTGRSYEFVVRLPRDEQVRIAKPTARAGPPLHAPPAAEERSFAPPAEPPDVRAEEPKPTEPPRAKRGRPRRSWTRHTPPA